MADDRRGWDDRRTKGWDGWRIKGRDKDRVRQLKTITMSRIAQLFARKNKNVLNIYCTAGYPQLSSTPMVMEALQDNGADLIELGMPYSDPLADGPVIQASGSKALENGMTIAILFGQLRDLGPRIRIPVILMGYMNPVLQYGFERFCADAAAAGVGGLILPDLPIYEYETEYGAIIQKYGLDFIFLVTPETSELRIHKVDALSSGFLYAVSSSSTTGKDKDMAGQQAYFLRLQEMGLKNPVLVGFGIKDKETYTEACKHTNGVIIGSAYIKALGNGEDIGAATKKFLASVLD
jgi:tryptophan synthase alpha chain